MNIIETLQDFGRILLKVIWVYLVDLNTLVRQKVPALLKVNETSGNHEDRQVLKEVAVNAALGAEVNPVNPGASDLSDVNINI